MKRYNYITKLILLLLIQLVVTGVYAQQSVLDEAKAAIRSEDYKKAVELYEELLKTEAESAEVY